MNYLQRKIALLIPTCKRKIAGFSQADPPCLRLISHAEKKCRDAVLKSAESRLL